MTEDNEKKSTEIKPPLMDPTKIRKIIIETDGNVINLVSAEVSGKIELVAILQNLIGFLNNQTK